jgi:hypothetical protein
VRRVLYLLLAASMLLVPLQSVEAHHIIFEGEVDVEYDPDSLTLRPGDIGVVYIMVRNLGDDTLYFQVDAVGVDSSGSSSLDVFNHMFILESGGVDQVVVTIESRARFYQASDVSDVKITFRWGPNATTIQGGAFRLEAPRSNFDLEYDVEDDFTRELTWVLGTVIVASVVASLVIIIKHWRARRKDKAPPMEPYGEWPRAGKDILLVRQMYPLTNPNEDGDTPYDPIRGTRPVKGVRWGRPPRN